MRLRFRSGGLVVDKSLNQSRSLGPFALLFPEAPVIWLRRDPLDKVVNLAVNQTLGRTVITAGTTFFSVLGGKVEPL